MHVSRIAESGRIECVERKSDGARVVLGEQTTADTVL
jgi:hypothetical protein